MPLPSISSARSSVASSRWNEEVINFLAKQIFSLLMCKYKYEQQLRQQLGFISFPVTEVLMDLFLGFKKVKGSSIRLSSQTDWRCVLERLQETEWPQRQPLQLSPQPSPQPSPQSSPQLSLLSTEAEERSPSLLDIVLEPEDTNTSQPSLTPEPVLPSTPEDEYTEAEEQEEASLSEPRSNVSSASGTSAAQVPQPEALEESHVYNNLNNLDEVETYGFMAKGQPQGAFSASSSLDGGEPP